MNDQTTSLVNTTLSGEPVLDTHRRFWTPVGERPFVAFRPWKSAYQVSFIQEACWTYSNLRIGRGELEDLLLCQFDCETT